HSAAATWYARNGLPAEALRHALAAGDWDGARLLMERHWRELLTGSGYASPVASAPAPPETVATDARLMLAFAMQRHDAGDIDGLGGFWRLAEQGGVLAGGLRPGPGAAPPAGAPAPGAAARPLGGGAGLRPAAGGVPPPVRDEVRAMALTATATA